MRSTARIDIQIIDNDASNDPSDVIGGKSVWAIVFLPESHFYPDSTTFDDQSVADLFCFQELFPCRASRQFDVAEIRETTKCPA
jgi:hypothetical protein